MKQYIQSITLLLFKPEIKHDDWKEEEGKSCFASKGKGSNKKILA